VLLELGVVMKKQTTNTCLWNFISKTKDLTEYLLLLEEAVAITENGKELELFAFSKVGQGLPLWLPKGAALRERLEQFEKKHKRSRL
jgi:threonyl-tRNA synthetase